MIRRLLTVLARTLGAIGARCIRVSMALYRIRDRRAALARLTSEHRP